MKLKAVSQKTMIVTVKLKTGATSKTVREYVRTQLDSGYAKVKSVRVEVENAR